MAELVFLGDILEVQNVDIEEITKILQDWVDIMFDIKERFSIEKTVALLNKEFPVKTSPKDYKGGLSLDYKVEKVLTRQHIAGNISI